MSRKRAVTKRGSRPSTTGPRERGLIRIFACATLRSPSPTVVTGVLLGRASKRCGAGRWSKSRSLPNASAPYPTRSWRKRPPCFHLIRKSWLKGTFRTRTRWLWRETRRAQTGTQRAANPSTRRATLSSISTSQASCSRATTRSAPWSKRRGIRCFKAARFSTPPRQTAATRSSSSSSSRVSTRCTSSSQGVRPGRTSKTISAST
mmetsp:Transcript_21948/g.50675  ORF Transcript_21948/g.50675 Transcript_21948/m.50675 type:complete len:205 (-) Transcript_21948:152-766(-)